MIVQNCFTLLVTYFFICYKKSLHKIDISVVSEDNAIVHVRDNEEIFGRGVKTEENRFVFYNEPGFCIYMLGSGDKDSK